MRNEHIEMQKYLPTLIFGTILAIGLWFGRTSGWVATKLARARRSLSRSSQLQDSRT